MTPAASFMQRQITPSLAKGYLHFVQIMASQVPDVGSIPIARSINPVDAVEFTGFPPQKTRMNSRVLDAVGREIGLAVGFGRGN